MSTKSLFTATVAFAFAVLAATASAQPQHTEHDDAQDSQAAGQMQPMMGGMSGGGMMDGMGGMMGHGMMMELDASNLSEQQRKQLAALHGRQAEQHFMLMMQMKEARQQLQELSSAQPLDMDAVEQAYDRLAEVRKEMFVSHIQAHQQVQEIVGSQETSGNSQGAHHSGQH